jgi:hypothetical protein
LFIDLILLELKGLEKERRYFSSSLISVERSDSVFLFLPLAVFSGFNCHLCSLISSKRKRKAKDFFMGSAMASKRAFFCYLVLEITLQSIAL